MANTDHLTELRADVAEIRGMLTEAMHGDPNGGRPGLWIRIDRLERFVAAALFIASTAFVAAVGAVVSAFTGHK